MGEIAAILDEIYLGPDRLDREAIVQRAVDVGAPVDIVNALFRLPDGVYSHAEAVTEAEKVSVDQGERVPAENLSDDDLMREMDSLHQTRNSTLRHGSDSALAQHTRRTAELEAEYLRRFPQREVDPSRLREGARERTDNNLNPMFQDPGDGA
jgi:hypothetical protein